MTMGTILEEQESVGPIDSSVSGYDFDKKVRATKDIDERASTNESPTQQEMSRANLIDGVSFDD